MSEALCPESELFTIIHASHEVPFHLERSSRKLPIWGNAGQDIETVPSVAFAVICGGSTGVIETGSDSIDSKPSGPVDCIVICSGIIVLTGNIAAVTDVTVAGVFIPFTVRYMVLPVARVELFQVNETDFALISYIAFML